MVVIVFLGSNWRLRRRSPMLRKIFCTSALVVTVLVLGCAVWAQSVEIAAANPATHTLIITLKGKIGPLLSGPDPLGLNGQSGTVRIVASESLSPIAHTTTSATYKLPPGAITVTAGTNKF